VKATEEQSEPRSSIDADRSVTESRAFTWSVAVLREEGGTPSGSESP
jgi:hypothetical protein